jgi:hypothetical protein
VAVLDYGRYRLPPVVNVRPSTAEVFGIPSRALARIPTLGPLLGSASLVVGAADCRRAPLTAFLGPQTLRSHVGVDRTGAGPAAVAL